MMLAAMSGLAAVAVIVCLGMIFGVFDSPEARLRRRAIAMRKARLGQGRRLGRSGPVATAMSVKRAEQRSLPLIESLATRLVPRQSLLRARIERAGLALSPGGYLMICAGVMATVALAVVIAAGLKPALAVLIGVSAGAALPHLAVGFAGARRKARFLGQFPDAIDLIVRGVKSGLPVTESMTTVGREFAQPLGREFQKISDGIRFGRPLDEMLWETARRLETQDFNFFVITLSIQQETGGNLAETLANLSDILRKRRQMKLKVKALSSEAKASALILGCLPFVMFLIIQAMNPGYGNVLVEDPRGMVLLGVAFGLLSVGGLVMTKMIRFEI